MPAEPTVVDTKTIDTSRDATRYGRRNYRKSIGVDNRRHWNGSFVSEEAVVEDVVAAVEDVPEAVEPAAEYQTPSQKIAAEIQAEEDSEALAAVDAVIETEPAYKVDDYVDPAAPATEEEQAAYNDFASPLNATVDDDADVATTSDDE